jgi:hypothetical protein
MVRKTPRMPIRRRNLDAFESCVAAPSPNTLAFVESHLDCCCCCHNRYDASLKEWHSRIKSQDPAETHLQGVWDEYEATNTLSYLEIAA